MSSYLTSVRKYFHRRAGPSGIVTSAGDFIESSEPERYSSRNTPIDCHQHSSTHVAPTSLPASGLFNNARYFTITNPQMNDFSNAHIQQLVLQTITQGDATLERLYPYTCTDAGVNSSARYPPPRCHEGTREKVGQKLKKWLHDPGRQWKAMWLYGPAGTGKSAVAQTFAEYCEAEKCLGASFFFSRPNHRDKYETVVPTMAYQLATSVPSYRVALATVIAADPTILDKAPRVQLRHLIIDPFTNLHIRSDPVTRKPLLIVLDGLDECHGLDGQLELVEMINEVNQSTHLSFLWLICSRPEPHLTFIFSRAIDCDRHQLVIDADTRQDVRKYLRDGFIGIQQKLWGSVDESWPPSKLFDQVVEITNGLFVLGTAILGYVGNLAYANPDQRLIDFLAFMEHADRIATDNPLETLDLLYSRVLMDIPDSVMPMTRRILHHCIYEIDIKHHETPSTQVLANFLCMNQQEFKSALRSLHSILKIPSLEDVAWVPLQTYHASFKDYLSSPSRAGRFFIGEDEARAEFSKSRFFWYNIILENQVSDDDFAWYSNLAPEPIFPNLKWTSSAPEYLAREVNYFSCYCNDAWKYLPHTFQSGSADILSFCDSFKFQYMQLYDAWAYGFLGFLSWVSQQGVPGTLLRTEPIDNLDTILLKSLLERLSSHDLQIEPMAFPLVKHKVNTIELPLFVHSVVSRTRRLYVVIAFLAKERRHAFFGQTRILNVLDELVLAVKLYLGDFSLPLIVFFTHTRIVLLVNRFVLSNQVSKEIITRSAGLERVLEGGVAHSTALDMIDRLRCCSPSMC